MPARTARPAAAILTRRGPAWSCGRILPGHPARDRRRAAGYGPPATRPPGRRIQPGRLLGLPGAAAYSASKQAVVTLMQSLRLDLHRLGIQVTVVCPGYVDTAMITEEERATVRGLVSADDAALRVAWAIERGRAEYWFPWWTAWRCGWPAGCRRPCTRGSSAAIPKWKNPNRYAGAPLFSRKPTMPTMISRMHSNRLGLGDRPQPVIRGSWTKHAAGGSTVDSISRGGCPSCSQRERSSLACRPSRVRFAIVLGHDRDFAGTHSMLYGQRQMRTTLDIDDDVLRAADQLSAREQKPPGKLISESARRGIRDSAREHSGPLVLNGFEILPHKAEWSPMNLSVNFWMKVRADDRVVGSQHADRPVRRSARESHRSTLAAHGQPFIGLGDLPVNAKRPQSGPLAAELPGSPNNRRHLAASLERDCRTGSYVLDGLSAQDLFRPTCATPAWKSFGGGRGVGRRRNWRAWEDQCVSGRADCPAATARTAAPAVFGRDWLKCQRLLDEWAVLACSVYVD